MPLPDRLIRSADRRVAGWRELEDQVNADLAVILGGDIGSRERTQLRRLAARLDRGSAALASDARVWLTSQLSAAWASGGIAAQVGRFEWTGAHRSALRLLVDDTFDELLANTRFMSRDVKQLARSAGRLGVLEKVGSGTPAKAAGHQLAERLRSTGVTSVTYADGRNIRASTYAEMLVRTKTAASYNLGGLNQMVGAGVRYVECVDGADCGLVTHDDGDKPNGRILPVDVAGAYPQSHPNCRRDWIPRPDVRDDSESMVATSWRSPEQISDQANYERYLQATSTARRRARQARTARTTRTPRTPREVAR
jgi:hypothetical protein